jgi:hypothetical protein
MAVDAFSFPIAFQLTGGEVHDTKAASNLIKILPIADYIIADKGYDQLKRNYASMLAIAGAYIWLPM